MMFGSSLPPGVCRRARVSFYDNGYVPLVVSTFRFFPHSRLVSNIGTSSIIFSFFRIIILETIFITNNTIVHIVLLKKFASSFLLKITYFPLHQKHCYFVHGVFAYHHFQVHFDRRRISIERFLSKKSLKIPKG